MQEPQETQVWCLGRDDPLEKEMVTHWVHGVMKEWDLKETDRTQPLNNNSDMQWRRWKSFCPCLRSHLGSELGKWRGESVTHSWEDEQNNSCKRDPPKPHYMGEQLKGPEYWLWSKKDSRGTRVFLQLSGEGIWGKELGELGTRAAASRGQIFLPLNQKKFSVWARNKEQTWIWIPVCP